MRIELTREPAPLAKRNKTRVDQARERIVLRWSVGPYVGLGEATPLEGWGEDSLELAEAELASFDPRWPCGDFYPRLDRLRSPSARFALELAAFDLASQRRGTSFLDTVRRAFGAVDSDAPLLRVALVDPNQPTPNAAHLKIKLGLDLPSELELATAIRRARPDAGLRFDANGTLGDDAPQVLEKLAQLGAEMIEEPPLDLDSPVPVALDESLNTLSVEARCELYRRGKVAGVVLKPMALGGLRACMALAREAATHGVWSIASHLWTGSIARRGEEALAHMLDGLNGPRAHGLGWEPRDERLFVSDLRDGGVALVDDEGTWTWAELAEEVARDPRPASPVRVALQPRVDRASVVAILAAIDRGNPLVLIHPEATAEQRARRVERVGVLPPHPADDSLRPPDEAPLALAFTSGTTGEPKVAVLSRRAVVAAADASEARLGWFDDDRWLLSLPPAHVGGLSVIVRCLLARRAIVIAAPAKMREAIERHRVTIVSIVPTILHRWLREGWVPPAHLRLVLVGGAACSEELRARAIAAGYPIATTYGLTETCGQVATRMPGDDVPGVGRPLKDVQVRIVDDRIHVSGPTLMDGYLGSKTATWLDTGDFGELDEGRLVVHGRRTDLIVSGGENVYPAMVEPTLVGGPIESACVFGVPDAEWGEVVAAAGVGAASADELVDAIRDASRALARHQRPRAFVHLETLPRTPSGKVDRRALKRVAEGRLRRL